MSNLYSLSYGASGLYSHNNYVEKKHFGYKTYGVEWYYEV